MTSALYLWMSADLDPSTEPYNIVGREAGFRPRQTWQNQCETSTNGKWQHNQQLKHKLAVTDNFKTIWKSGYVIGTTQIS